MTIDELAELNAKYNELKKELEKAKTEFKKQGEGNYNGSNYQLVVEKRVSKKLNEDSATEIVKSIGASWLLKEVVDLDKLEDSIAVGEIDATKFEGCIETKETLAVKFIRRKKCQRLKNVVYQQNVQ